ncbi:MAG: hypothetical protein H8E18_09695 [FCB group bacterium]|nr:hypothetical protein [FCB group bacterium]
MNGSTLSGTVDVSADATDNEAVEYVEFYIDGGLKFIDNSAPWTYAWDTESHANGGQHSIHAKAYDVAQNVGSSALVNVTIPAPSVPTLSVSPDILAFADTVHSKTTGVTNIGTGTLTWTITDNKSWLTVSPINGTTTSETDQITVTVNRNGLDPGEYIGEVTVSSDGGVIVISVTMTVNTLRNIQGYTYYSGTSIPVSGVMVSINGAYYTTGTNGYYMLSDIVLGNRLLTATKDGYDQFQATVIISEGDNTYNVPMTSALYTHNLYGTISTDTTQLPLSAVTINVLNDDGTESLLQTTSDVNGYYQVPTVPQGQRMIRFQKQNYQIVTAQIFMSNSDYEYNTQLLIKPGIPTNSYPMDGSIDISWSQALSLTWDCSDPEGDEIQYDIYFGADNPPIQLVSEGQSSPTLDVPYLLNETTYYWKVIAKDEFNNQSEGPIWSFTTENILQPVIDIDGNIYATIQIGYQVWMAENLKAIHYRNGIEISHLTSDEDWRLSIPIGAYCYYNNESINGDTYGILYNWYAATDASNIAPEGWHVPTETEWQTLADYLGGESIAGGKIKEAGTEHWLFLNTDATNEFGFTALPGGYRTYSGYYDLMGYDGYFWSTTEQNTGSGALHRSLTLSAPTFYQDRRSMTTGFSVRCVKD